MEQAEGAWERCRQGTSIGRIHVFVDFCSHYSYWNQMSLKWGRINRELQDVVCNFHTKKPVVDACLGGCWWHCLDD